MSSMTCAPKLPPFSGRVFNNNGDSYEEVTVQRRTDHCDIKGTREWLADEGCLPPARHQLGDILKWKAKYGGLNVSDARKLKALEAENNKLKKLLAEQMLDNAMLKDIASKKW